MAARHLITGCSGEQTAAEYLQKKGLRLITRNFRCRAGEIDLICSDGAFLVFVEVKTRSGSVRGAPGEAVDAKKRARLIRAASLYLSEQKAWSRPCRFDLVSVVFASGKPVVEHWEDIIDAWDALGGSNAAWQPW